MKNRILLLLLSLFAFLQSSLWGQSGGATFQNPILPGFHPDPSICRVGMDYYLVTSSFEWYPGIPIYHSRDLMNWQQIGYVLNRPSQLQMKDGLKSSNGLWAPTIRYHEGIYYVICTAQQAGGTFYVTARKPEGPYSEPVFLKDAPGIDPSLFFDDDGTCWYTGSINDTPEQDKYPLEDRIYLQQLDVERGEFVGERHILTSGHAINAPFCEAPHLYKVDNRYLLLVAEGGTWENHACTVFSADKVTGPYVPAIANPVLTHRHLGNRIDITTVGHADLVQTHDGNWWAVALGVRPVEGYTLLGRETFLTPVTFQNGFPIFNEGVGRIQMTEKATGLPVSPVASDPSRDDFDADTLRFCWNFLRTPFEQWYQLKEGRLVMKVRPQRVMDDTNPSLIARRVEHIRFSASLSMEFRPSGQEEAGMIVMQNGDNHYRVVLTQEKGKKHISLIKRERGTDRAVSSLPWTASRCFIKLMTDRLEYRFLVGEDESGWQPLGEAQDASINSSNKAGGFTGSYIGMYTSSNGQQSNNKASFDYFDYQAE